ncbi:LysE family translocator [candidate division KSB1 bacterium]|nr:LysE family translocator [candidate division KSB1 bacterium]RQW08783.1 MAG: LysE family translocator [candidate division KSB1 bacterium]
MIVFLLKGFVFGLSAGVSPGPLMTLLLSETLLHKTWAGVKVAFAPLLTDGPIILACFFLLKPFSHVPLVFGLVSLCGALYIFYLGLQSIRLRDFVIDAERTPSRSLMKGILANALNPHPYLFWISVGSATMIKALDVSAFALAAFLFGFYFSLVGAKILLAVTIGASRRFLSPRLFLVINRVLGVVLMLFAGLFFYEGVITILF